MPSFGDSAFIFVLALILFGPKRLPELARQLGKLMAEFRRASNEFRMQMDEELRIADQAEQQKKIAAMEAAAPAPALPVDTTALSAADAPDYVPTPEATEAPAGQTETPIEVSGETNTPGAPGPAFGDLGSTPAPDLHGSTTPLPIATEGTLSIMPPATGLPIARDPSSTPYSLTPTPSPSEASETSALTPVLESIPHTADPDPFVPSTANPATNGNHHG